MRTSNTPALIRARCCARNGPCQASSLWSCRLLLGWMTKKFAKIIDSRIAVTKPKQEQFMGKLEGKVAVITGAASGMGRATAVRFAKEGAAVVVADLNSQAGEETIAEIAAAGGSAV